MRVRELFPKLCKLCNNNCDYDGKGLKIWVKAIRDIKKGEEFTCDYGFVFKIP